jgi:nucleoside-triphosphatase
MIDSRFSERTTNQSWNRSSRAMVGVGARRRALVQPRGAAAAVGVSPGEPMLILIEARPGAGKTTALQRLAELLRAADVALAGFVTAEIREHGTRVGFSIETFDGQRGTLAHRKLPGPPRVGRYGVALDELERVALPAVRAPAEAILIDEIGKMELASEAFRDAVSELAEGETPVVATVHTFRHPFTDALKRRPGAELVHLSARNRDDLPGLLARKLVRRSRGFRASAPGTREAGERSSGR